MAFDLVSTVIGLALQNKAAKKAASTQEKAAEEYSKSVKEAATPVSVFDPTGYAYYDEGTKSYQLGLSPEVQGLFSRYLGGAARDLGLAEKYSPQYIATEATRRARDEEAVIEEAGKEAVNSAISKLLKGGRLGTKAGSRALADIGTTTAKAKLGVQDKYRTMLTNELVDAINRAQGYQTSALGLTSQPISLSQIGRGTAGTLYGAAATAGSPLRSAMTESGIAGALPYYGLGQSFLGAKPAAGATTGLFGLPLIG